MELTEEFIELPLAQNSLFWRNMAENTPQKRKIGATTSVTLPMGHSQGN